MSELRALTASSAKYVENDGELFGPPTQTEALPMEWLWYPYIPRYGLTIIAGDPGQGKSMLVALLIGIITSGRALPLTGDRASGKRVLVLSAEDNWARDTLHRLLKAGAVISNIHVMHKFRALTDERLDAMGDEIKRWKPDLVIIDTLSAYMGGGRDMHRQNEVGEFLARLTEMAESTGAAIIGLAHLNKQSGESPLYRIVGSIGFVASIRSALFLGSDPQNRERLALAHGKANASEKGKTIIFEKEGGGRDAVLLLKAVGFSDADEVDVCEVQRRPVGRPGTESEDARQFILDFLSNRPMQWARVLHAAKNRNVASEGTLNVVRAELSKSALIIQVGKGPSAKWQLAIRDDAD
jgi:hypothetical protein